MMELFQTEYCPYCAKVRTAIETLGISVTIINAPKGSEAREKLVTLGGKQQVPFLVNTKDDGEVVSMYESDDIISYLQTYGSA